MRYRVKTDYTEPLASIGARYRAQAPICIGSVHLWGHDFGPNLEVIRLHGDDLIIRMGGYRIRVGYAHEPIATEYWHARIVSDDRRQIEIVEAVIARNVGRKAVNALLERVPEEVMVV